MRITLLMIAGSGRPPWMRYFPIARCLAQRGHAVRVLALHPDFASCTQRRFVQDGVEVWYVGQMHVRKATASSVPEQFGPLQLVQVLMASAVGMIWGILCSPSDVYHLCKPQPINGFAALLGIMLFQRRRFYVDCDDDETVSNRFSAQWQRLVFAFWQWLLLMLAKGVTVNTHFMEQRIRNKSRAPLVYVPNGVDDTQCVRPDQAISDVLRSALGLATFRVVAYAGTLTLQNHAIDLLLKAFAYVVRQVPDAKLLLIGGGEDMPVLRQQVATMGLQQNVVFIGQVPPKSMPTYLSLANVSVDPVHDNVVARARSPLKVFESMAVGVPVVTGDVGDRKKWLDDGRAGVLVQPGDATALAQGIVQVLSDEDYHLALSKACLRHIQHYNWCILAAQWEQVYEK